MNKLTQSLERLLAAGGIPRDILFLALSAVALGVSLFAPRALPFHPAWVAILLCGLPIVLEAFLGLVTALDIKADLLVSLALIASVLTGEIFAAGEVAFIMELGGLLEELTVARARAGIQKLVRLTPQTARLITPQGERIIPAQEVRVGDRLRVLPGEGIPVDGVVTAGQTSINQAVMTGESLPVDKKEGDPVSSGTVNQFGAFEMEAVKVGEDSSIQRMIRLVQSADAGKAKIVGLADRWATWVVVAALSAAAVTWAVTGEILRAVTILVVFCPCALVLATPTAIMAAIGNAARHGFLVREGDALERLAAVTRMAFDKTGTLTRGFPQVVQVAAEGRFARQEVFALAAAAEQLSEHPLGKAVVASFRRAFPEETLPSADRFQMVLGRGVSAQVAGRQVLAGNRRMMEDHQVAVDTARGEAEERRGRTVVYLAVDGQAAGWVALADTLREESADMVARLGKQGVRPVLLTGDNPSAAAAIAGPLGIGEVYADCLPEEKLRLIRDWQAAGEAVCMMGDGINDAPALKTAAVGIAMGGVGSDIAVEAADIALVDDEVKELPHLVALSRRMMTTIRLNLAFSMGLNFLAVLLAIASVLNPVTGALVHNAGSVLVILSSALLLGWKERE